MKKQLIATAVALVLNSTAFAAVDPVETPTQNIDISLSIDDQPPTLTLGGGVFTGGSSATSLDFDNDQKNIDTIRKSIGEVNLTATNYSPTYSGKCKLLITSANNWKLVPDIPNTDTGTGGPSEIPYGITKSTNPDSVVNYGYNSAGVGGSLAEAGSVIQTSFSALLGQPKTCTIRETLDVVINDFPRPVITGGRIFKKDTLFVTGQAQ